MGFTRKHKCKTYKYQTITTTAYQSQSLYQAFTKLGQTQQDKGYVAETDVQIACPLPQQLYVQCERPV